MFSNFFFPFFTLDSSLHLIRAVERLGSLYNHVESQLIKEATSSKNLSQDVTQFRELFQENEIRAKELEDERNILSLELHQEKQIVGEKEQKLVQMEEDMKLLDAEKSLFYSIFTKKYHSLILFFSFKNIRYDRS